MNLHQWISKIKTWNREQILILLLAGVLLLVIALPTQEKSATGSLAETEPEVSVQSTETDKTRELEQHLAQLLAQVDGIGKAEVMLTLKSGGKKIVEKDTQESLEQEENQEDGSTDSHTTSSTSESTVVQRNSQGEEVPYVTEELEPEIAGVLIIAQGAGDPAVVAEITEAVEALFGVEAHKIKVMKME
jgi:stage III sporulation protein AG